jgi:hypothetical protein
MKEDHLEGVGVSGRKKVKQTIKSNGGKCGLDEFAPGCISVASCVV